MDTITPYITATITILGIAYPILLQVISRLDEKYSSEHILELFNKEISKRTFKFTLIINLIFIVIWSFKLEPQIRFENRNIDLIINNSANLLLGISSIILVISFFLFVDKILTYYTPKRIVTHFSKKHRRSKIADNRSVYIEAMGDILVSSIKKHDKSVFYSLTNFFNSVFTDEREKQKKHPVVFPEYLYVIIYNAIEELVLLKSKRNSVFENRIGGGLWLLGLGEEHKLSKETFSWLWSYLRMLVENKHDEMLFKYWSNAHNYYQRSIPNIIREYDESSENFKVINEDQCLQRENERLRFFEFHYFLGGLLLFGKRYDCIRRIFRHTTVEPPRYELLPEFMSEIFYFYNKVRDPYLREYPFISSVYPFPKNSGFGGESVIKRWVYSYLTVLFLRQYTLHQYYSGRNPLEFPILPDNQGEIKLWINGLPLFKRMVRENFDNQELMEGLGFDYMTPQWLKENDKLHPIDFIEELERRLDKAYTDGQYLTPIDPLKQRQFEYFTRKTLASTIESIINVSNKITDGVDSKSWYIHGYSTVLERDAFAEKSEITHIDFDSFLANALSQKILSNYSNIYNYKKSRKYLLKPENVFKAIDKMNLNKDFVIICFNVFLDNYIKKLKIEGLSKDNYGGIPIYWISGSDTVGHSFFILRKTDLPEVSTLPIDQKFIDKYRLKSLDSKYIIHASVVDLKEASEEILNENRKDPDDDEIKKSVLLNIHLDLEIKWKNKVDMVQIVEYSEYKQKGLESDFKDIIPFFKD